MVVEHQPSAAKSVRNIHGIPTKNLSQAVNLGYIKLNPADMVTLPRVEKKEIQPLTDAQVSDFLKAVESDADYGTMLKVILFTGLRESEAVGLRGTAWTSTQAQFSLTSNSRSALKPLEVMRLHH